MASENNTAANYNIKCNQSETFQRNLTYKDSNGTAINLTGYTAKLQIRKDFDQDAVVTLTEASGITLGGAAGTIAIEITAAATALLERNSYLYDLVLTSSGGIKTRILEGRFDVVAGITR